MLKAVFADFYGTMVHENGPIAAEVAQRIYESGSAGSPEEVFRCWWESYRKRLESANGPNFHLQRETALANFKDLLARFQSSENPEGILSQMEEHWSTTAAYEDAKVFMDKISVPVYFVTNSDDCYVSAAASHAGLHPAGIITSEQARCYKPNKGIFLYALEKAGCTPGEVVHIGDSISGDVECARSAGIKGIWLNREGRPAPDGVVSAGNLMEALELLFANLPNN